MVALWVVRCGGGMKGKVCGGTVRGKGVGVAAAWERMGGRRVEERGVLFLSRVCVCVFGGRMGGLAGVGRSRWGGCPFGCGGMGGPMEGVWPCGRGGMGGPMMGLFEEVEYMFRPRFSRGIDAWTDPKKHALHLHSRR